MSKTQKSMLVKEYFIELKKKIFFLLNHTESIINEIIQGILFLKSNIN